MALAQDTKGRNARKWASIRRKAMGDNQPRGLSGAALEKTIMALAAADPSLVKIQGA